METGVGESGVDLSDLGVFVNKFCLGDVVIVVARNFNPKVVFFARLFVGDEAGEGDVAVVVGAGEVGDAALVVVGIVKVGEGVVASGGDVVDAVVDVRVGDHGDGDHALGDRSGAVGEVEDDFYFVAFAAEFFAGGDVGGDRVERGGRGEGGVDDLVFVSAGDDVGVNHDAVINVEVVVGGVASFGFVADLVNAEAEGVVG